MKLKSIRSGGQIGADEAGLAAGKFFGLKTGGYMPKGFMTLCGSCPNMAKKYGMEEHPSEKYPPRTYKNVETTDGTVRLAVNFESSGERCTLKAIKTYDKPWFDVDLADPPPVTEFLNWLEQKNIEVLNVAGNSENSFNGAYVKTLDYLLEALFAAGFVAQLSAEDILTALGIKTQNLQLATANNQVFSGVKIWSKQTYVPTPEK